MNFYFDDNAKSAKIAVVRKLLGGENPFIKHFPTETLLEVFQDMEANLRNAAAKLSEITETEICPLDKSDIRVQMRAVLERSQSQHFEIVLSQEFLKRASEPYFAVRKLEEMEKANTPYDPEIARKAMNGLKDVLDFARLVPAVYREITAAPAPLRAVA